MPTIQRVHHVACRCLDAKQTVDWYQKRLGMGFVPAIAEDAAPSTKAPDPYISGIDVVGPMDHTICQSICFLDPHGYRLELAANTGTPEMMAALDGVKWDMLEEWSRTRCAPRHVAWMHDDRGFA